jgi:hypothetical protein
MNSDEYAKLIEKLRRIEALYDGATTIGERDAAAEARRKVAERLADVKPKSDPATEYRFSMENAWSRKLFVALARRSGLKPYRYPRQRRTTVMLRLTEPAANSIWAEFQALNTALSEHLDALATQIIAEAVSPETGEAEEVPQLGPGKLFED